MTLVDRMKTAIMLAASVLAYAQFAWGFDSDKAAAARLNNLGAAYMNQQSFERALTAFENASKLEPTMDIARLNQGIALLNMGRVDNARVILEGAAKRDPKDPRAWYNLGLLYKNSNDVEKAIDAFRRVTEIDPSDADTWYFLGSVCAQLRQFPQAIDAFDQALKLNPLHASSQFGLARAYQQSGDLAKAKERLQRFQYVTQNKLGTPISVAYGEQGQYSRAEEVTGVVEKVPPRIAVQFVDVTKEAGLSSKRGTKDFPDLASLLGAGACFLDYDGDGRPDIFLDDGGPQGGMALYHNLGNGRFEDASKNAGIDSSLHGIGCTAGDYDNDGATDLAVSLKGRVLLLHNEKNGRFADATVHAGLAGPASTSRVNLGFTFVDYDHDGDLDLFVSQYLDDSDLDPWTHRDRSQPAHDVPPMGKMWRNNGNETFTDVTTEVGLASGPVMQTIGSDFNNDRAVDLVQTGPQISYTVMKNPREGKFVPAELKANAMYPTIGVAALDFDHDGWMDLVFTHGNGNSNAPAVTLMRNKDGKSLGLTPLPDTNWVRAWGVGAFDYDNDGWVDLVAVGETKEGRGEVKLFRNLGPDGFKDVTAEVGLDKIQLKDPRAIVTADYDGDGATDLLITQNNGPAVLLKNEGGNKNHWLRLSLKGLNDNKSAVGAKVEVFSAANRQKFEIAGSSGYLGQNSMDLVVGLGHAKQADVVRMLWPTGVLQDEIEIHGDRAQAFTEIDRRGSSCPTLFVWNGKRYELVADVLGAGVLGHWVGAGQRNIPRPTEVVKLDRGVIAEKDGKISFRLMEPMEEVVYLDQVKLLAVDHPGEVDVYPDERFVSNPPYPDFKIVTSRAPRLPAGAWDDEGRDLLPDIVAHRYFGDFDLLPFKGFAKLHGLELDLGENYRGGPLRLLLHGEIEYFTATGMYAADQAGIQATAPYLEALNAEGRWVRVVDDMGFPAGLPRTMIADLSGKLPKGTRRIRISTNLQIYWDSILTDRSEQNVTLRVTPVSMTQADLGFHGYPRQIEAQPPGNVKYVYEQVSRTGPYARQAGTYTRYGDVTPLLAEFDDRPVVFGSGEEVALEFDPSKLPVLPNGWERDFFLQANGYEKDMDFYAAEGGTVEPMPFQSMGSYPYPGESFPLDDSRLNYLLQFDTRYVSGNEPQGYGYDYRPQK